MVPVRFSSAKLRIVIAGIRKRKTKGARLKRGSRSANPDSRMLKGVENTQREC